MYHYVRVVTDPKDQVGINLSVKPELFDAQMQYLADKGYTTLTMQEVYEILNGQKTLPAKPIALTFDDGYRDFYTNAWPILQKHNFKATNYVITDFIGWDAYMTWPMLQELDATGQIELGAHTRSHADLRTLSNERRWDEIIGSKSILEQGLGHPIGAFCYPAGFYNAAVIADVKRAKFLTATTVEAGTKQNLQSAFEMPRVRVNGPDPLCDLGEQVPITYRATAPLAQKAVALATCRAPMQLDISDRQDLARRTTIARAADPSRRIEILNRETKLGIELDDPGGRLIGEQGWTGVLGQPGRRGAPDHPSQNPLWCTA